MAPQLEKVVRSGDQVPFAIDLPKAPQQEAPQPPDLLGLSVRWFHDRLALGVDAGCTLASELEGHSGSGIGISTKGPQFRRQWLPAVGDVGIDALIAAGLGLSSLQ